jgi:hypothetical protein
VNKKLICFFNVNGIVHKEFVPSGQTVNQYFYLDVLKRLRESLRHKRPESWRSGDWLLHHGNAPATSNMVLLPHPPYSLDVAPCNFFYSHGRRKLKGKRFSDVDEMKENTLMALKSIPCQ